MYWEDTDNQHRFTCTKKCPDDKKYHVESNDPNDEGLIVCAGASHPKVQARFTEDKADAELMKNLAITGGVIVFVAIVVVLGVFLRRWFIQNRENMPNGTTRMTEFQNEENNLMQSPIHLNDSNYLAVNLSNAADDANGFMQMETDSQLQTF